MRWPWRILLLLIVATAAVRAVPLAQDQTDSSHLTTQPTDPAPALPTSAEDIEHGRRLFVGHCATCHGPDGEGGKGPTLAQPKLSRAGDDASLYEIIRRGIEGTEMPRSRLERSDVARVAAYVKALGVRPVQHVPGDPSRGAEIYAKKAQCATCHMIRGVGGAYGGDLTDIGRRRSAAYLRRAIVEPNVEVPQSFSAFRSDVSLPQNFLYVRVQTRGGRKIEGVRVNEDTFTIQIREVPGKVHSLLKSDLKRLHKDFGKSPMPSYADALRNEEIDDLVAFLVSLRDEK